MCNIFIRGNTCEVRDRRRGFSKNRWKETLDHDNDLSLEKREERLRKFEMILRGSLKKCVLVE
jgi:hypothetical protein